MSNGVYSSTNIRRGPLAELWRYRTLVKNLTARDVKVRHKQSFLGLAWIMLSPLIMMAVMALVFAQFFGASLSGASFSLYVFSGLLPWTLFSSATAQGLGSIVGNGTIIRRVYVPKAAFPVASVASGVVNFGFTLITLLCYMLVTRAPINFSLVMSLIPIAEMTIFALGMTMALATLYVFFRDVRWFYDSALLAWFYATPIFYPPEIIGERYRGLMELNPLWPMLRAFRRPIMQGLPPTSADLASGAVAAVSAVLIGWLILRKFDQQILNYL
jgi:ABC-2 type transport system permease protein